MMRRRHKGKRKTYWDGFRICADFRAQCRVARANSFAREVAKESTEAKTAPSNEFEELRVTGAEVTPTHFTFRVPATARGRGSGPVVSVPRGFARSPCGRWRDPAAWRACGLGFSLSRSSDSTSGTFAMALSDFRLLPRLSLIHSPLCTRCPLWPQPSFPHSGRCGKKNDALTALPTGTCARDMVIHAYFC